jgi:uncharacterized protein YecT (DUF1311 family)
MMAFVLDCHRFTSYGSTAPRGVSPDNCCSLPEQMTCEGESTAGAGVAPLKEARQNCEPAGNQQEMNQCAAADYYAADLEMNRLYGTQMARLSAGKGALRELQKAWLVFRDKVCAYEVPADNGSIYSMSVSLCLAKHTKQRVEDLRAYVACTDNGCPE